MFSGIVAALAQLSSRSAQRNPCRLCFETQFDIDQWLAIGQSVAVDGICLTVIALNRRSFCAEASSETLSCTTLAALKVGERVNLEAALSAAARFDGHIVSGHVDGVGIIKHIQAEGQTRWFAISAPDHLMKYIAAKGSVCVNGTSLVSHRVVENTFYVNVIPHTLAVTSFADKKAGDRVNIEVDLLARYVERLLAARADYAKHDSKTHDPRTHG